MPERLMSIALDVAVGVVFLYLLLALMVTICQELLATGLSSRAHHLYGAIEDMLQGDNNEGKQLAEKLYRHPLIRNLTNRDRARAGVAARRGVGLPSYIPSKTFALALIDVLQRERGVTHVVGADRLLASANELVGDLPAGRLKDALSLLLSDAERLGADVDARAQLVSTRIETWFNDRMARASGWYKRRAQVVSLVLAGAVTLAFNADSLHAADRLWKDAGLRAGVVAAAESFAQAHPELPVGSATGNEVLAEKVRAQTAELAKTARELRRPGLPLGWRSRDWSDLHGLDYLLLALGWAMTTLAVSLGAAFWFDLLSKVLQVRAGGLRVSASTGEVTSSK